MAVCRIQFSDGGFVDIDGGLDAVIEELHRVATRREHTFAVLRDSSGAPVALRPEAVLHIRPVDASLGTTRSAGEAADPPAG